MTVIGRRELTQAERDQLEQVVDSATLADVVEALGRIAHEKAEHLRSNWQDNASAKPWTNSGNMLDRLSLRLGA